MFIDKQTPKEKFFDNSILKISEQKRKIFILESNEEKNRKLNSNQKENDRINLKIELLKEENLNLKKIPKNKFKVNLLENLKLIKNELHELSKKSLKSFLIF